MNRLNKLKDEASDAISRATGRKADESKRRRIAAAVAAGVAAITGVVGAFLAKRKSAKDEPVETYSAPPTATPANANGAAETVPSGSGTSA